MDFFFKFTMTDLLRGTSPSCLSSVFLTAVVLSTASLRFRLTFSFAVESLVCHSVNTENRTCCQISAPSTVSLPTTISSNLSIFLLLISRRGRKSVSDPDFSHTVLYFIKTNCTIFFCRLLTDNIWLLTGEHLTFNYKFSCEFSLYYLNSHWKPLCHNTALL